MILLLLMGSCLAYNAPLLILVVAMWLIPIVCWRRGIGWWAPLLAGVAAVVVIGFGLLLPVVNQKQGISIFNDPTLMYEYTLYRQQFSGVAQKLVGNYWVYEARLILEAVIKSFSPQFWQHGGSHPWHQLSGEGHVTIAVMIIFDVTLIYQVVTLVAQMIKRQKWWQQKNFWWLVILLVTLVPSVITTDSPHATRSLQFFWVLAVGAGWSLADLWSQLVAETKRRQIALTSGSEMIILVLSVGIILLTGQNYWTNYQTKLREHNIYHNNWAQLLGEIESERLTLVRGPGSEYEYINIAWVSHMSPEIFWSTLSRAGSDGVGLQGGRYLANFHFVAPTEEVSGEWQKIILNEQTGEWEVQDD